MLACEIGNNSLYCTRGVRCDVQTSADFTESACPHYKVYLTLHSYALREFAWHTVDQQ